MVSAIKTYWGTTTKQFWQVSSHFFIMFTTHDIPRAAAKKHATLKNMLSFYGFYYRSTLTRKIITNQQTRQQMKVSWTSTRTFCHFLTFIVFSDCKSTKIRTSQLDSFVSQLLTKI